MATLLRNSLSVARSDAENLRVLPFQNHKYRYDPIRRQYLTSQDDGTVRFFLRN